MVLVPDTDVEDDDDDEPPLATMHGDFLLGSTLGVNVPDTLLPSGGVGRLEYCWCRSVNNEEWEAIPGSNSATHVLGGQDVGCFIFAEWSLVSFDGETLADGATEGSEASVRILAEDREELKEAVLTGRLAYDVSVNGGGSFGPAQLSVNSEHVRILGNYFKATQLSADDAVLSPSVNDPLEVEISSPELQVPITCQLPTSEKRELFLLAHRAFVGLAAPPSNVGAVQVWEGEAYGDYYASVHGDVVLLHDGLKTPSASSRPTEALILFGCCVAETDSGNFWKSGFELSIEDSDGEQYNLCFPEAMALASWRDAIASRNTGGVE